METFAEKRRALEKEQSEVESQKDQEEEFNNIMSKLQNTSKVSIPVKIQ